MQTPRLWRAAVLVCVAASATYLLQSDCRAWNFIDRLRWSRPELRKLSDDELVQLVKATIEEVYGVLCEIALTARRVRSSLAERGIETTREKLSQMILARGFQEQIDASRFAVLRSRGLTVSLSDLDRELTCRRSEAVQEALRMAADLLETSLDGELPVLPFVDVRLSPDKTMSIFKETLSAKQGALEKVLVTSPELTADNEIQSPLSDLILQTCKGAEEMVLQSHQDSFDVEENLSLAFRNALAIHSRDESFNKEKTTLANSHTEMLLALIGQEPTPVTEAWLPCQRDHPLVKRHGSSEMPSDPTRVPLPVNVVEVSSRLGFQQYLDRVSTPHMMVVMPPDNGPTSLTLQTLALSALNKFAETQASAPTHICVVPEPVLLEEATDTTFACLPSLLARMTTMSEALGAPTTTSTLPVFAVMHMKRLEFLSRDIREVSRRLDILAVK
ncbi:MAG: hypothetical protein KVP17_000399 [Porospora cf. gigantea B]|uniref:uncharacterized protein n=1 Tax=Porospora cf. gigantea B TaxID=2853592 RepID=UPI003571981F|nr:MAG: hypothetical protein KVP17_000399 [Porospora cf. gigantea B]